MSNKFYYGLVIGWVTVVWFSWRFAERPVKFPAPTATELQQYREEKITPFNFDTQFANELTITGDTLPEELPPGKSSLMDVRKNGKLYYRLLSDGVWVSNKVWMVF